MGIVYGWVGGVVPSPLRLAHVSLTCMRGKWGSIWVSGVGWGWYLVR